MPYLITDREHFELQAGSNALGGSGSDSVRLSALARLPHVGSITLADDGPPSIQRLTSRVPLKVDGAMLGAAPVELVDGSTIQVGGVWMTYRLSGEHLATGASAAEPRRRQSEVATQVLQAVAPPSRPAGLISLVSGQLVKLGAKDLVIGRSEHADIVLTGERVSRRHAIVRAENGGHTLIDESTNGTFVNGIRLTEPRVLQAGDVLAFGEEQYRYDHVDVHAAAFARNGTALLGNGAAAATPMAELEAVRGAGTRTTFPIVRPVCAIGRGAHNDVCLPHESVSASHATLLLKGDTWYLTDLRSANGTYVDGYRVAGERAVAAGATIRMGHVELVFRPMARAGRTDDGTHMRPGLFRRIAKAIASF